MTDIPILNSAFRSNLLALQKTQELVDETVLRLSTGLKVGSALDKPQNFFAAQGLNNRASDLSRRLDGISTSIRTIQNGISGVEAIDELLLLAESNVTEELKRFREFGPRPPPPPVVNTVTTSSAVIPIDVEILADNPGAYWRLDDVSGAAGNLGTIGGVSGTYVNGPSLGAAPLFVGGGNSVDFNGANQRVNIPDSPLINLAPQTQRTVELVFNADTTAGRQVLYEEGATVNALAIYIDNGQIYVTGRDAGAWGPANISAPIVAGQTYHVGFSLDSIAGEFIGYLDGSEIGRTAVTATFPSHSGDVAIGGMRQSSWFHDGSLGGDGLYFDGRISDVALYNDALSADRFAARYGSISGSGTTTTTVTTIPSTPFDELDEILDQVTRLTVDASYRGINLLGNEDLTTLFNEDGTSRLITEGVDFTALGLGIERLGFETETGILHVLGTIYDAQEKVRRYGNSLSLDFGILEMRERFTRELINGLRAGAKDLTIADANEEGANLIALQTRQELGTISLSLAQQSNQSTLNLFV